MNQKREPAYEDYLKFDGAHCGLLWNSLADDWRCPSCNRTKFELLRWTRTGLKFAPEYRKWQWFATLARHHDHQGDANDGISYFPINPRFPETIICGQCNNICARLKLRFNGIDPNFSFAPYEMRRFVTAKPHGYVEIDFVCALTIYRQKALK